MKKLDIQELKRLCESVCGIDLSGIEIVQSEKMSWRKRTAKFSILKRNRITICGDNNYIPDLVPKICHEWQHREDYIAHPIFYVFCMAVPFLRYYAHEPRAEAFEQLARLMLQEYYNNKQEKKTQ